MVFERDQDCWQKYWTGVVFGYWRLPQGGYKSSWWSVGVRFPIRFHFRFHLVQEFGCQKTLVLCLSPRLCCPPSLGLSLGWCPILPLFRHKIVVVYMVYSRVLSAAISRLRLIDMPWGEGTVGFKGAVYVLRACKCIYVLNIPWFLSICSIKLELAWDLLIGVKSCLFLFVSRVYVSLFVLPQKLSREFTDVDWGDRKLIWADSGHGCWWNLLEPLPGVRFDSSLWSL